jgi:L-seryl-tRNA(Ser) seleniumtransferase
MEERLKKIPGVDILLNKPKVKDLLNRYPRSLVRHIIQLLLKNIRMEVLSGGKVPDEEEIVNDIRIKTESFSSKSLRPVINCTGIIIHTNLGRAPFGDQLLADVQHLLSGYSNLEFDLEKGERGSRYVHVTELMKFLTGAEDVLVVNNNAAAVMLILRTFAKDKEAIISRGELIEIGGSFRMPDIMAASDCKMVEVGTTNKTKITDFENAISKDTSIILKAHKSNYVIKGFTTEPPLSELVDLGKKTGVMVVYDMGSGLLRKAKVKMLDDEPDVRSALATGVDLVTFSGDKLLGGPQAGIIAGRKSLIEKLRKEPMTRALRVGKTVLALLESICMMYLDEKLLIDKSPLFAMMNSTIDTLEKRALLLADDLKKRDVGSKIIKSAGQAGGGSLPYKTIESYAVVPQIKANSRAEKNEKAKWIYHQLLSQNTPILGALRKGELIFDVLTLSDKEIKIVAEIIANTYQEANRV